MKPEASGMPARVIKCRKTLIKMDFVNHLILCLCRKTKAGVAWWPEVKEEDARYAATGHRGEGEEMRGM